MFDFASPLQMLIELDGEFEKNLGKNKLHLRYAQLNLAMVRSTQLNYSSI